MNVSTLKVSVPEAMTVEVTDDTLTAELSDGRTVSVPLSWYPRLIHATPEERQNWRLIGAGEGIHWPALDEDISVEMLLGGWPSGESQKFLQALVGSKAGRASCDHPRNPPPVQGIDGIVPMRPSPENGAVPDGWQLVRLGDVAEVNTRTWDPSEDNNILYLDLAAVVMPGVLAPPRELAAKDVPSRARRRVQAGDILVSTVRPNLRGFARVTAAPVNLIASTGFAVVTATRVDGSLLYHHVMTDEFANYLEKSTTGQAYPAVRAIDVANFRFAVGPLPEQQAIATVLDSIDEAIEGTEAVIAATDQVRDSLLHELLTCGIPGWHREWKEVPGIGTIPASWEVVRLGEVAGVHSGVGFPLERQGRQTGVFPFIKVSDMNLAGNETYVRVANNYVVQTDVDELGANVLLPGTIVFPKVGAAIATNKKRMTTVPTVIDNNMVGITVSNAGRCDAQFLFSWFDSIDLSTLANVSAVPSITGSRLKRESVPLPPLSEQQAIAAALGAVEGVIERAKEERGRLQSLQASAADALLTGRVRVPTGKVRTNA